MRVFTVAHFPKVSAQYTFDCTRLPKKKILKIKKLMSCINFRMMKAIIKIFRRETHWRIEEKWGNQFGYNLYGTVNN